MSSPATSASARRARRLGPLAAALTALALMAALGGCGEEESNGAQRAQQPADEPIDISGTDPVGQQIGGSVAPLAMCSDWNGATEPERLATIDEIRTQLGAQDPGITAPELTDDEAGEIFDTACEPSWAAGFRLYKIYSRAVGFVELKREIEVRQGG